MLEQSAVERDYNAKHKISLGIKPRTITCISNLTNPISKTFMRSTYLLNSAFLSLKIIVDTLTDVGDAKHQNITS